MSSSEQIRERDDRIDDFSRRLSIALPTAPARNSNLRVNTTLPANDEDDFSRRATYVRYYLLDQRTHDSFLQSNIRIRIMPASSANSSRVTTGFEPIPW
jgi:hypothetical protein